MQKLAELEATAPKVSKKKMLNEDSTTPPMNVSNKPASFKDVFENMAMQKPIPVVGKQGDTTQTGAGFLNVTDNSPAAQALSNALGDLAGQKKVQIVVPTQPGQQQSGQPNQAGATGQPQAGQMQMKEKKLDELSPELLSRAQHAASDRAAASPTGPGDKKNADRAYKFHGARNDASERDRLKRVSADNKAWLDGEHLDEISKGKAMQALQYAASDPDDERSLSMQQKIGKKWPEMKKHAADAAYTSAFGRMDRDIFQDPDKLAARAKTSYRMNKGGTANKQDLKARFRRDVDEGAKVDRMVKHIEKSEKKLGKSKEEAQDIAWATANKRGMLDNKNKKKVKEGDIAPTNSIDTRGAGLGAGRSATTLEGKKMSKQVNEIFGLSAKEKAAKADKARSAELDQSKKQIVGDFGRGNIDGPLSQFLKIARVEDYQSLLKLLLQKMYIPALETVAGYSPLSKIPDGSFTIKTSTGETWGKPYTTFLGALSSAIGNSRSTNIKADAKASRGDMGKLVFDMEDGWKIIAQFNTNSNLLSEAKKPDFLDLDKDGNKKEPMKKAAADKNKKKVKESMNHRISAARLEGKSHGLRGHAHSGKRYEDLDEMKAYHEGYKDGMDELHEMGMYETAPAATVGGMASQAMPTMEDDMAASGTAWEDDGRIGWINTTFANREGRYTFPSTVSMTSDADALKYIKSGQLTPDLEVLVVYPDNRQVKYKASEVPELSRLFKSEPSTGMEEGNAFTAALAKTPKGGKFSVGGKTFTDRTSYDSNLGEYAFESLDNQLNALLTESEKVNEGLSVSVSKGNDNSEDSVNINATGPESEHLMAIVKSAGLGLFGDDHDHEPSSAMSIQPAHGAADEVGAGGVEIGVVDGHDGMMGLMQKLSGIQAGGAEDYADEEGGEEQLYGNHEAAGKKDCGCDGDCECSDYDQPSNEETCNECGGMMEAGHSCGSKEMVDEVEDDEDHDEWYDKDGNVDPNGAHDAGGHYYRERDQVDEVESEDQMEFEVAEDNAPDSGAAETTADENAEAEEDAALAKSDSKGGTYTVNEEDDEEEVAEGFTFESFYKKLAMLEEKDTEEDEKAEKAGKKVTKDIEYDDKKDKKEKVDEWANQVGSGPGKGTDASFEQDIEFMTKVIAGGLNKPKSTGQTTVPVIAGQDDRMHDNPSDWAALAGIRKA